LKSIAKYDDSTAVGKYYALDLDVWTEVEHRVTSDKRLGIGRESAGEETAIFVKVGQNDDTFTVKDENGREFLFFNRKNWMELRKVKGVDKYKPMQVSENGTIWIGESFKGCEFRVFTKLEDKE
jgi:hypothetical protein